MDLWKPSSPNLDLFPFSRKESWGSRPRAICPRSRRGWSNFCVPAGRGTSYLVPQKASWRVAWLAGSQTSRLHCVDRSCYGSGALFPASSWWRQETSVQWEIISASRTAPAGTAFSAGWVALRAWGRLARVAAAASYIVFQSVRVRRRPWQSQDVRDAEQQLWGWSLLLVSVGRREPPVAREFRDLEGSYFKGKVRVKTVRKARGNLSNFTRRLGEEDSRE